MNPRLRPWLTRPGLWLVTVPWLALTLLHYVTPAGHPAGHEHAAHLGHAMPPATGWGGIPLHLFHDVYRRLYYWPILAAALLFGTRTALITAALVSVSYLPHVLHRWDELPTQRFDALFEIALYFLTGALVGRLAEAGRRQQAQLLRADQLRAVGELAAGMAHEVRNPLASITGAAERLKRDTIPPAERLELLEIVAKESSRLDGVLNAFLAYARPAPLARAPGDLNAVLRELTLLVDPTAKRRGIRLVLRPDAGLPAVTMDAARITQAVLNLVLNAVQAAPDGSEVEIASRLAGGRVEVRVSDRGAGVAPHIAAAPFTPFATTKPGGTGLGLPTARQIVEAHGGTIVLRAADGAGTQAVIVLPTGD